MRTLIATLATLPFLAAALSGGMSEPGMARPGGTYATVSVDDAQACAHACSEDSLCMAWTYRSSGACELKAVVTRAVPTPEAVSGLSRRAPGFARGETRDAVAEMMAPAEELVAEQEQAPVDEPAVDVGSEEPPGRPLAATAPPSPQLRGPETDVAADLAGGPTELRQH